MPNQTVTGFTPQTVLPSGNTGLDTLNRSVSRALVAGTGFEEGLGVTVWNTGETSSSFPHWTGELATGDSPQSVALTCQNPDAVDKDANDLSEVTVTVGDSTPYNNPDPVHEESTTSRSRGSA